MSRTANFDTREQISIGASPALRQSNLSVSSNGLAAFVLPGSVRVENPKSKDGKGSSLVVKGARVMQRASFVSLGELEYLAVASDKGVHLFDVGSFQLVAELPLSKLVREARDLDPSRTTCCVCVSEVLGTPYLATGTSFGTLAIVHFDPNRKRLSVEHLLNVCDKLISVVASSVTHVLVGNETGSVSLLHAGSFEVIEEFPGMGAPCASVAIRGEMAIAGFACGTVRVFNVSEARMTLQIEAHCRTLNAMALHPTLPVIATVGEDCFVNVWQLPGKRDADVRLVSSEYVKDELLVGVDFSKDTSQEVWTVAYDTRVLTIFR